MNEIESTIKQFNGNTLVTESQTALLIDYKNLLEINRNYEISKKVIDRYFEAFDNSMKQPLLNFKLSNLEIIDLAYTLIDRLVPERLFNVTQNLFNLVNAITLEGVGNKLESLYNYNGTNFKYIYSVHSYNTTELNSTKCFEHLKSLDDNDENLYYSYIKFEKNFNFDNFPPTSDILMLNYNPNILVATYRNNNKMNINHFCGPRFFDLIFTKEIKNNYVDFRKVEALKAQNFDAFNPKDEFYSVKCVKFVYDEYDTTLRLRQENFYFNSSIICDEDDDRLCSITGYDKNKNTVECDCKGIQYDDKQDVVYEFGFFFEINIVLFFCFDNLSKVTN